jgi:putative phosphoribosyl transferase
VPLCSSPIASMLAGAWQRAAPSVHRTRGVLGLPRGGVPVASEVARALGVPLDVIVVRKLGVPFQPESGMGAIGEDGVRIINDEVVRMAGVSEFALAAVEVNARAELERRARRFRGDRPRIALQGRTAVIVDDGIATGSTARAACRVARAQGADRVVVAVPVVPRDWEACIGGDADECIAFDRPQLFWGVGQYYSDHSQTSDDEVVECLMSAAEGRPAEIAKSARVTDDPPSRDEEVEVPAGQVRRATPLGRNALPPGRRPHISEVGHAGVDRRRIVNPALDRLSGDCQSGTASCQGHASTRSALGVAQERSETTCGTSLRVQRQLVN